MRGKIAKTMIELSKEVEKCMDLSKAARKRVEDLREDVFEETICALVCK